MPPFLIQGRALFGKHGLARVVVLFVFIFRFSLSYTQAGSGGDTTKKGLSQRPTAGRVEGRSADTFWICGAMHGERRRATIQKTGHLDGVGYQTPPLLATAGC